MSKRVSESRHIKQLSNKLKSLFTVAYELVRSFDIMTGRNNASNPGKSS